MNNWYVITGGPSAGKTTLIEALEKKGFKVIHEAARIHIDEQLALGKTIEEIREDEEKFQHDIFYKKIEIEDSLDPEEVVFLDRGMHDSHAYNSLHGFNISDEMEKAFNTRSYKKVFLLEQIPYEKDYARTESPEEAQKLNELMIEAYENYGNIIHHVPTFGSIEKRLKYFLNHLKDEEGLNLS